MLRWRSVAGQLKILAGYSLVVSLILLIGGIIMLLGIIGEHLGRIFVCINRAPQYVIGKE